jgi:2-C-methyl-D-erythritol 4-phosphate cytidylyltransferase/2-C-methyl-D-erythritol 2,4-cyclodiphosphate synthase
VDRCSALTVAAGRGERLGLLETKPFVMLGRRPLLAWSLQAFARCTAIDSIVLVVAARDQNRAADLASRWGNGKVIQICPGGPERIDSVKIGLNALPPHTGLVAIHDSARPLVTAELIQRVVDAAWSSGAAIAALPVRDTVKRGTVKRGIDERISETLDRSSLFLAQTPQVFAAELIRRAHAGRPRSPLPTDDAQLVERLDHPVQLVQGDPKNFKITTAGDLELAEAMLAESQVSFRTGTGYDVHRLVEDRPLMLGGVELEFPLGLWGHSDADVLCHAVGDALLGAAGLGDLGTHFPDCDPALQGLSGLELLKRIQVLVAQAGLCLENLDVTVICEAPRLSPHLHQMRENLARALEAAVGQINIKATTTEGLGFIGRQEGIAAEATVLLKTGRSSR